ncbi:pre-toxin TG domain-containing protein [Paenibacillus sambharensis]|uniref:pre-toxin TG domain-containing protein n=1 Tax=Paenibacillus sambharensis TaxID=1803190 RepID=UPI0015E88328|nr:pre-toxin TG domain-containing protein [Paenibacillus sambharensis]
MNKLSSVTGNVRSIGNGVDGQIKARRGIGGRLSQAAADAQSIHQKLMSVETFMRQSSDRYQTMERQIQQRIAVLGTIGVMSANFDAFNLISISDLELKIAGIEKRLTAFIPALFDLIKDAGDGKPLDIQQLIAMAGNFVTAIGELTIRQIQLLVKTVMTPLPIDEDMLEALNRDQYLYLVRLSMKEGSEGDWARQQLIEARALLDRLRIAYIGIGEKAAAMDMMGLYASLSNTADLLQQLNSMGLLPEKEVFTPEELAAKYDYDDKRKGMVVINGYGEVISVNQENLDELLRRYKAERWGNLNAAKVYDPRFNRNIKEFLDYTISLGYDPRTFEYVGADIKDDPFAEAFVASQQGVSDKHSEEAKKLQDEAIGYISTGLDFIPGVGNFKSLVELAVGKTMAGEELSGGDKVMAWLGIGLPWLRRTEDVVSGIAKHGDEALDAITGAGKHGDDVADGAGKAARIKSAKEVEIVNQRGESLGEFDEIDLNKGIFYEDKSAQGLNKVNPKTGLPAQTPQEFANKQILTKTRNRISALENATSTRTTVNGSQEIPTLEEIKGIKEFVFRLDGDTPELRQAVYNSVNKLKEEFPDYKFSATFGGE